MFSFISGPTDPNAPTFHPVTNSRKPNELFGPLEPQDTEWTCAGGFITETQVWYHFLNDGTFLLCQIIHSSVGVWFPAIQFTCKIYNPATKEQTWRSVNVSNFATPPPANGGKTYDKRSSRADEFSVYHNSIPGDSEFAESYTISANLSKDLQISLIVSRPSSVPGWKIGQGPKGGFSYYGLDINKPDGYVIHRFWPHTKCTGHIIHKGKAITADGIGMFVHAIQGMRPNLVASRWNFADFQSTELGGVSAVQMELTTTDAFGKKGVGYVTVNIGSLVVGGKLVSVTAETIWPGEGGEENGVVSRAIHLDKKYDKDTSYDQPSRIKFLWKGPGLGGVEGEVKGELEVDVGGPEAPKGLLEKVDVLAEIPYAIKLAVNYLAGTKPYIYQWFNPATLTLTVPSAVLPSGEGDDLVTVDVQGALFNEATFIS